MNSQSATGRKQHPVWKMHKNENRSFFGLNLKCPQQTPVSGHLGPQLMELI